METGLENGSSRRKVDPEVFRRAKEFCTAFRIKILALTKHLPPSDTFGRDIALSIKLVRSYTDEELSAMGRDFFRWRVDHGALMTLPTFFGKREVLAHYARKQMEQSGDHVAV